MRSSRRSPSLQRRRVLPAKVRPAGQGAVDALRRSREALTDIQGQLDALLGWLGKPGAAMDATTPDRLARSARAAAEALASIGDVRRLV